MKTRNIIINKISKINAESLRAGNTPEIIRYLDTSSITRNRIENVQTLDSRIMPFPSRAQRKVRNGTIVYSTVRPEQEHFGFIDKSNEALIVSTGFLTIDLLDKDIDSRYLYYLITQKSITSHLQRIAVNNVSSYPSINPDDLGGLEFFIPAERSSQVYIASVLSALDARIELNQRINAELEAIAKTIYDYWFVQFDFPDKNGKPYKSSGGKMVWNGELKREIPAGWEVKNLGKVFEVKKGDLITGKTSENGSIKVVAGGLSYAYFHSVSNRDENTVTISGSGANAGYVNFWREKIFASDCTTVRGKSDIETIIAFHHLKLMQTQIYRYSQGSAQPHVYPTDIKNLPFVNAPNKLYKLIEPLLIPLNKKIAANEAESQTLTELRDWLLPMLMNGQVKVS